MLKLHGFAQSGNTFKVAFLLRALGLPWQPVPMSFADFAAGATRDPAWREGINAMGEVPVLEEESGRKRTQSGVILTMLAERHGKFGGRNDDERWEALRWLFFDNHKFTSYFATWRFMKSFAAKEANPAVAAFLKGRIDSAFSIVDKHLAGHAFMVMAFTSVGQCARPEGSRTGRPSRAPRAGARATRRGSGSAPRARSRSPRAGRRGSR